MPAVVVLALTLALAPAPSPSATSGPVGDLLGGVGRIVDDLLGAGSSPSVGPPSAGTPTSAPTPRSPGATGRADPTTPVAVPPPVGVPAPAAPARPVGSAGTGTREAAVPLPGGDAPAPIAPPGVVDPARDNWPPVSYLLVLVVLLALGPLLLRRRAPGPSTAPVPAPDPAPAPDPGPPPDNVSRLPTGLNAVYELGRLDERLAQERDRRT